MANEIFREDRLALELIAEGSTIDNDPGYDDKEYRISTCVFRMNHIGLNIWNSSEPVYWNAYDYESREEYEAKRANHEAVRETLENGIRELLGLKNRDGGFSVSRNVAEIFTAVLIEELPKEQPAPAARATVAEALHRQLSTLNAMLCMVI